MKFIWCNLEICYHTAYPSRQHPAVFCHRFCILSYVHKHSIGQILYMVTLVIFYSTLHLSWYKVSFLNGTYKTYGAIWKFVTILPILVGSIHPAVFCHLFPYPFICAPTTSNGKSSIVEERILRFVFVPSKVEERILRFVFVPSIVEEQILRFVFVTSIVEEQILHFVFIPSIVEEQILRFVFVPSIVEEQKHWFVSFPLIV